MTHEASRWPVTRRPWHPLGPGRVHRQTGRQREPRPLAALAVLTRSRQGGRRAHYRDASTLIGVGESVQAGGAVGVGHYRSARMRRAPTAQTAPVPTTRIGRRTGIVVVPPTRWQGRLAVPGRGQVDLRAGITPRHDESDAVVRRGRSPSRAAAWSAGRRSNRSSACPRPVTSAASATRSPPAAARTSARSPPPGASSNWSTTPCVTTTSARSPVGRRHEHAQPTGEGSTRDRRRS